MSVPGRRTGRLATFAHLGRARTPSGASTHGSEGFDAVSYAQQRLWFLDQLAPGDPSYNMPSALRLRGRLDAGALGRALDEVVRRHEALRTVFPSVDGQPRQAVQP